LSPILVRPVREQLEHDRVIRLLQAKYKRKFEVGINPGNEQGVPVGTPPAQWFPDLVLQSTERSRKIVGIVEVETAESVNNLEAMSQWVSFSKLRVPLHLYVPQSMIDPARRLCADLQVSVAEIWMYHMLGDQMRFTLVQRSESSSKGSGKSRPPAVATAGNGKPRPAAAASARPRAATPARPDPRGRATRPAAARPARRATPAASAARRKPAPAKSKTARTAARMPARKKAAGSSRSQKRK
jgi:hypothetical protein